MAPMSLNKAHQQQLLTLAKQSIRHGLDTGKPIALTIADYPAALQVPRASFVTLQRHGRLRGCIGVLQAIRPLAEDVAENAFSAAFKDPRFVPLSADQFSDISIQLSLLTAPEPLTFESEPELLTLLKPGLDGLILQEGKHQGTFLPSVWESLPDPEQFLGHLKQKAGLTPDYWSDSIKFFRYGAESVS